MARNKKKDKKTIKTDVLGGLVVVFGLILLVFLKFDNIGFLSDVVKTILRGLFSEAAIVIPLIFIYIGMYMIVKEKRVALIDEIMKGFTFSVILASVLAIFASGDFSIKDNIMKYAVDSYQSGIEGKNISGFFGETTSVILVSIMGVIASRIILVFLSLVSMLYFLNISIKDFFGIIFNVISSIAYRIYDVFYTLFSRDEDKSKDKLSKAEKKRLEREMKLQEKGNLEFGKNLKTNHAEQVEFDFNKLDTNLSEAQKEAKQQRDEFFKKEREQKEDKSVKEVLTLDHTKHYEEQNYVFPSIDILRKNKASDNSIDKRSIHATAVTLQKTLSSFGVEAKVTNITKGPTVTRYELSPNTGVKVSRIVNLADDIALNLAAKSIRIEAPIPGKAAVGIEVPNTVSDSVGLREIIESDLFKKEKSKISFALGKDAAGEIIVGDIAKMPHVLIAGATGSGKSVSINSLLISILYKAKPSEVKMILVDPKMVELSGYNGIPHLLIPVVTDPKKAAGALNWAVQEMVRRYSLFASKNVKDIIGYNREIEKELDGSKLPQILIVIDELADLMMVAPNDVEDAICRLAQMARAAGMHLVVATQRPSVDVITGIIKANIPSRIAFTVSSQVDSRTILDMAGAEKLLGKGDMLYFPVGESKPLRIQGAFISEKEISEIVESVKKNNQSNYNDEVIESIEKANKPKDHDKDDVDEADALLEDAIDMVIDMGQASASMLQRRFKIGYSRAGRIIDQMELRGLISGYDGSKPRHILITKDEWQELKLSQHEVVKENKD